ncbi:hypothetical protein B0H14DRAFT_2658860 [Mycena olivaceomarginata]|nr:hypothetical protein B0H14DRAFT_2658860 [Mycena olivaceomarginata]
MSSTSQSIEDIIPFTFFNAPNDSAVVTDALLDGAGAIDYNLPPYRLTDADVLPTPGRPLLTVSPSERGPSRVRPEGNSWPPFYFLSHPAIYRLMPFVRVPARVPRTDPTYLATILDPRSSSIHSFPRFPRSCLPVSRAGGRLSSPLMNPRLSPTWDTYPPLSTIWIFPGTEEFPMDQPLRDPLSVTDHTTLLRIARPNLRVLVHFMARNHIRETNGPRMAVSLLDEALAPAYPFLQPYSHACTCYSTPSPRRSVIGAIPSYGYVRLRFYVVLWRRLQDEHPSAVAVRGAREESTSPHYRPTTPPSVSPVPNPATPPSQTGPSAVGSASFDIRALRGSARKGTPSPRRASVIAASPSHSAEMQVDSPEMSSADALAIAEALDDPPPRMFLTFSCSVALLALLLEASEPLAGCTPRAARPRFPSRYKGRTHDQDQVVPEIVTPPASEAYNEDGEEEKDDEEERRNPYAQQSVNGRVPAPPRAGVGVRQKPRQPPTPSASSRFPLVERKNPGKRKKDELPPYVPPRSVPNYGHGPPRSRVACKGAKRAHRCGNELVTDLSAAHTDYELAREQLFRAGSRLSVAGNHVCAWIRERISPLGADGLPGMGRAPERAPADLGPTPA